MSVQGPRSMPEPGRVGLAFLTALAFHAGALAALTLWQSRNSVSPPGEQEITLDLAPMMQEAEAIAPAETSDAETPPDETEAQPAETPATEALSVKEMPRKTTEAVQVEALSAEEPDAPKAMVTLPPPKPVMAQPLEEKPVPKPVKSRPLKKAERKHEPIKRSEAVEQRQPPSNARQGQASRSSESTAGSAASADPTVLNRYLSSLASSLRGRLRYPGQARSRGLRGVATVRFTMTRSGQIISASLARTAGNPLFDEAALAAARPGSSLPAAPASLPQQQFTFTVPLRFDIR